MYHKKLDQYTLVVQFPTVMKLTARDLSIAGLIAALYALLSLVFQPISFGIYQVRVAEALTVLPFLTAAAIPGLYIGCILANVIGGMGWMDIVIGPLITLVAAFMTRGFYRISKHAIVGPLVVLPVLALWGGSSALLTGGHLGLVQILGINVALTGLGMIIVTEEYREALGASLVYLRVLSLVVGAAGIFMQVTAVEPWPLIVGVAAWCAAWLVSYLVARWHFRGENLSIILAPLPPVVLNAFGVSAYLAPILGMDYWFAVQMVGIGQLVACYLIGLPLLALLRKRRLFF